MKSNFFDKRNVYVILLNLLLVIIYLLIAVPLWATVGLEDVPGAGAGDPIIWGLMALPVLTCCMLLNVCWLIFACMSFFLKKKNVVTLGYLTVPVIWCITLYIDFSHHWLI